MQSPEARSIGRLGVPAFAGTVSHIEKAHLLLSTLSFNAVPVGGKILRGVHDVIARPSYRAVRGLGCAAGNEIAEILPSALVRSGHPPVGSSGRSSHAQAALNAAIGDRLRERVHDPIKSDGAEAQDA